MQRTKNNSNQDILLDLYSSQGVFLIVNKQLLKHYGPEKAIFLSNLIDKLRYFKAQNKIQDNWFFQTHENQMEETGLTEYAIRKCKMKLKEDKILFIEKRGLPAREWYYIDVQKLHKILESNLGQDLKDSKGQGIMDSKGQVPKDSKGHKENKDKENKDKENKDKKIYSLKTLFPSNWQDNPSFQETLKEFIQHRKEKKQPITELAGKKLANKLSQYSIQQAIDALNRSIENGWTGVFPENGNGKKLKQGHNRYQGAKQSDEPEFGANAKTVIRDEEGRMVIQ
jgi:hypothetical protein